jgi:hypothetical protein
MDGNLAFSTGGAMEELLLLGMFLPLPPFNGSRKGGFSVLPNIIPAIDFGFG